MNETEDVRHAVESWYLGKTSAHYESNGQGVGAISTGKGDRGGVSYGAYQLSTRMGTLSEYLNQSRYRSKFLGLAPDTPEFNARWKGLAKDDPGFAKDQHEFIGRSHYAEQIDRLNAAGIDLSSRGRAVQDAIWSTSVQFRGLTSSIFAKGLVEKFGEDVELSKLSDNDIVEAVQDYKITHNASLFKSSPAWQPGLLRRAIAEKTSLLKLATQEATLEANGVEVEGRTFSPASSNFVQRQYSTFAVEAGALADAVRVESFETEALQVALAHLGYTGLHGHILAPDDTFGPNTLHAIKSFQRAHHLHVDGIVGKQTLAALEDVKRWPLLSEATHPQHRLYAQVEQGIRKLPHHAHGSERELGNSAVALTIAAHAGGLHRVDHVVLGTNGVNLFAVQGRMDDPGHRRVHVELSHAMAHAADHRVMSTPQPVPAHALAAAQQATHGRPMPMGP